MADDVRRRIPVMDAATIRLVTSAANPLTAFSHTLSDLIVEIRQPTSD